MKKLLSIGIILLFIGLIFTPISGNIVMNPNTLSSGTIVTLEPPEPDGENGWYVSDVEVTLNATSIPDVKAIYFKIGSGSWQTISGGYGTFIVDVDDTNLQIEYYAVDIYGNEEDIQSFTLNMDQTEPDIDDGELLSYMKDRIWYVEITAHAVDYTSGMDRVEFFIDDEHNNTIIGSGPDYVFPPIKYYNLYHLHDMVSFHHYDKAGNVIIDNQTLVIVYPPPDSMDYTGFILNPIITEDEVTFFAIVVQCSFYWPHLIIFERVTIPYNYEGYIGKYFIWISLNEWYPQ